MAVFKVIIPSNIKLIRFHMPIFKTHGKSRYPGMAQVLNNYEWINFFNPSINKQWEIYFT